MEELDPTAEVEHGTVTKYWWFLLIIPIGIIVGTVTSTCSHLKQDQERDEMAHLRVSEEIKLKSLEDDMLKAFETPKQDPRITLRGISSSNGLNHYLKQRPVGDGSGTLGYYDVKAGDEDQESEIVALAIYLDEPDAGSRAAQIGMAIAVMKSVFGETDFKHTLRFVFLPSSDTNLVKNSKFLTLPGERLVDFHIIKAMPQPFFEKENWATKGNILSHPVLIPRGETILTDPQVTLTFKAAKQLRTFLLESL